MRDNFNKVALQLIQFFAFFICLFALGNIPNVALEKLAATGIVCLADELHPERIVILAQCQLGIRHHPFSQQFAKSSSGPVAIAKKLNFPEGFAQYFIAVNLK